MRSRRGATRAVRPLDGASALAVAPGVVLLSAPGHAHDESQRAEVLANGVLVEGLVK